VGIAALGALTRSKDEPLKLSLFLRNPDHSGRGLWARVVDVDQRF